jgi:hypothetical protein
MRLLMLALAAAAVAQAQTDIQACSLLKVEEVRRALGNVIGGGARMLMSSGGDTCVYNSGKGPRVTIAVERSAGRGGASVADKYKAVLPGVKVREVRGLGDRAVRLEHPALGGVVSAFRGDVNVAVSVTGMRTGKAAGVAENLARKAISRVR